MLTKELINPEHVPTLGGFINQKQKNLPLLIELVYADNSPVRRHIQLLTFDKKRGLHTDLLGLHVASAIKGNSVDYVVFVDEVS